MRGPGPNGDWGAASFTTCGFLLSHHGGSSSACQTQQLPGAPARSCTHSLSEYKAMEGASRSLPTPFGGEPGVFVCHPACEHVQILARVSGLARWERHEAWLVAPEACGWASLAVPPVVDSNRWRIGGLLVRWGQRHGLRRGRLMLIRCLFSTRRISEADSLESSAG